MTSTTVLAGVVFVDEGHLGTVKKTQPLPEASEGSRGVAEPCVAGACIAESYQNVLFGSRNPLAYRVNRLVAFYKALNLQFSQTFHFVGRNDTSKMGRTCCK